MNLFKILIDTLLGLVFWIDKVVYGFIPTLYSLLLYLSNVDLMTGNVPIQSLIQRIYILVGVFMLFRLSFSIMNYIINPDAFGDQAKGFTNLVRRVLIAIVLLVGIPWFFGEAYIVQNKIITSGILPGLILGESIDYSEGSGNDELEKAIETSAKDVQFLLFGPFFSINYNSTSGELADCKPSYDYPASNILGTVDMARNQKCMEKIATLMDDSSDVKASGAILTDFFRYAEDGVMRDDRRKFESFGGLITLTLSNGDRVINYLFIASTICGGYLVFLLLSFCIDVASRAIRLLFLQVLSPIAVISYIDPTSSDDRLKDWARECVKVWASLFLRLLVVFLIIQLVRVISNSVFGGSLLPTNYAHSTRMVGWIYVFLIIGVFQAAKTVPNLIEKATGLKLEGELQLNPFKNPWVGAATGLGLAGLSSGIANFWASGKKIVGGARELYTEYAETGENAFTRSVDSFKDWRQRAKALGDFRASVGLKGRHFRHSWWKGGEMNQETWAEYSRLKNEVRDSRSAFFKSESVSSTRNIGSSVVGVATGAVSGAVRGAVGGYGKDLSGSLGAAGTARQKATDAREDRDVRGEVGMTLRSRLLDSVDRWAGVRSDKNYGAGRLDDEVKGLTNELDRVHHLMRASAEDLSRAQVASSNISDSTLSRLVHELNFAESVDARSQIIGQLNASLVNASSADANLVRGLINATQYADDLLAKSIDLKKKISKRENAANLNSGKAK